MLLDAMQPPLRSPEECEALYERIDELNDDPGGFADAQTYRRFGEALMDVYRTLPESPNDAGARAPYVYRSTARHAGAEAVRSGATVDEAVQRGMASFEEEAGYPMTHREDLLELRMEIERRAAE